MSIEIQSLKPGRLWYYFSEILKIPRPSKKEEKIAEYILNFGKQLGLETLKDEVGNVLIRKLATKGKEKVKSVTLQSHLDMVGEKNAEIIFDFEKDPIETYIDKGWIKAKSTTLGADDGIGVATQLAILEANDIPHGPIECLFTIDEESGMTGAFGLKQGFLKSNILINLDSEDEGELFIGCAGGRDTTAKLAYKNESVPENSIAFKININGLKGGHSGDEINKGLGNANKILNRLLWNANNKFDLRINVFSGGNLRNAIAREAYANIVLPETDKTNFINLIKNLSIQIKKEFKITDSGLNIKIGEIELPDFVIDKISHKKLLNAIYACPHGVITMSAEIPNFVETSTNLASVKTLDGIIIFITNQRSSVESEKDNVCAMVASVFKLAGAEVIQSDGYPGWTPDPNSEIVKITKASYKRLFYNEAKVLAIHAGLECGLFKSVYPEMDMISFGPTIKGAHSPDERLDINTVTKFWDLTLDVLDNIPE